MGFYCAAVADGATAPTELLSYEPCLTEIAARLCALLKIAKLSASTPPFRTHVLRPLDLGGSNV